MTYPVTEFGKPRAVHRLVPREMEEEEYNESVPLSPVKCVGRIKGPKPLYSLSKKVVVPRGGVLSLCKVNDLARGGTAGRSIVFLCFSPQVSHRQRSARSFAAGGSA